jgi:hypothetical protein
MQDNLLSYIKKELVLLPIEKWKIGLPYGCLSNDKICLSFAQKSSNLIVSATFKKHGPSMEFHESDSIELYALTFGKLKRIEDVLNRSYPIKDRLIEVAKILE